MGKVNISRRMLLAAGITAGIAALIPLKGLWLSIPAEDLAPIADGYRSDTPYLSDVTGELTADKVEVLTQFIRWVFSHWELPGIDQYLATVPAVLLMKTQQTPSYLHEYHNAVELIQNALLREGSTDKAYLYALFTQRGKTNPLESKLGRSQYFVFDELVRHAVATGGFRRFGLVNYQGYINKPYLAKDAYRKADAE